MGKGLLLFATLTAGFVAACGGGGPTPGGSCQSNRDCVTGETCISGTCQIVGAPGGRNDAPCPLGEYCDT
ncbi:unnamed protein product, partial [Laminaria digitata]